MRFLFLIFAVFTIVEIAVLVKVGEMIGGWNTIALVLLTAFIGSYFVKREGLHNLQMAQEKMQRNELPGNEIVQGLMLVVAGILMVTPGFVTDILGILLVLPGTRHYVTSHVSKHLKARVVTSGGFGQGPFGPQGNPFNQGASQQGPHHDGNGDVYEGQYTDKTEQDDNHRLR